MVDLSNENVIHVKKENIQYLQFRRLLEYDRLIHAYSLGLDVNFRTSKNNKPVQMQEYELMEKSYTNLANAINGKYKDIVKVNQCHTDNVTCITNKINEDKPDFDLPKYNKIDGSITNLKNIILSTTNADCNLFMFFDPVKNIIANTHSGWRGTLQRISVKTVEKMIKEYGCNPKDIICAFCPSIRKCCFEVEKEVKDEFYDEFQDLEEIANIIEETKNNEKWHIDLSLINKKLLLEQGLIESNIIDSKICSVCNSKLIHSFRVEKEGYGLETALIGLKE